LVLTVAQLVAEHPLSIPQLSQQTAAVLLILVLEELYPEVAAALETEAVTGAVVALVAAGMLVLVALAAILVPEETALAMAGARLQQAQVAVVAAVVITLVVALLAAVAVWAFLGLGLMARRAVQKPVAVAVLVA
jgi:hypothetical protein